ncbi:MAG: hypothetical protein WAX45_08905, partial [Trichococcus flocculiformis]
MDGAEKTTMMLPPMKGGSPEEQLIPNSSPPANLPFIGGGELENSLTNQIKKRNGLPQFFREIAR